MYGQYKLCEPFLCTTLLMCHLPSPYKVSHHLNRIIHRFGIFCQVIKNRENFQKVKYYGLFFVNVLRLNKKVSSARSGSNVSVMTKGIQ